jgi:peptidoglycan/xylan/chitin deacetylase (PgdA/CDA1 family)
MNSPHTPEPSKTPDRRQEYRPIMVGLTVLMITGLLTAACMPLRPPASPPVVPSPTPVAEKPPAPTPQPAPNGPKPAPASPQPAPGQPKPAPAQPKPLPERPADQPSQLVVHGDRGCQQIALTYDAGSGADGAAAILDTLKKHGVISTFFLTGRWVEKYPDLAKRIAAEGHEIANHTYSHPDLTKLPPEQALKEIQDGAAAIKKITGQETRPLFREPYGAFDEAERRIVRQAGFSYSVYWDVDTLDWQFPGVDAIAKKIMTKGQNGSIVLMHLNVPDSATASNQVIPQLRAQGYELVTVSRLLQCE